MVSSMDVARWNLSIEDCYRCNHTNAPLRSCYFMCLPPFSKWLKEQCSLVKPKLVLNRLNSMWNCPLHGITLRSIQLRQLSQGNINLSLSLSIDSLYSDSTKIQCSFFAFWNISLRNWTIFWKLWSHWFHWLFPEND